MRIASFVRNGDFDCGLVDDQERIHLLDECAGLKDIPRPQRLFALLAMSTSERREFLAGIDLSKLPLFTAPILAAAIPLCPLYLFAHNNNPTLWKRQLGIKFRWNIPRVTVFRVRPWTSFSGHGDTVEIPLEASQHHGCEFGVVLGREAWRVPEAEASQYIAGIVAQNDMYTMGLLGDFDRTQEHGISHVDMAIDTLRKASDGNGVMGPWITTTEELEDRYVERLGTERLAAMRAKTHTAAYLYDLLTHSWRDGKMQERAHTSSTSLGPEYLIAYFSRFMRLPAGTVIGLGAAGWDGQPTTLAKEPGATQTLEVELEHVGRCRTELLRVGSHRDRRESPFIRRTEKLGLRPDLVEARRPGRSLWICRGNYMRSMEVEKIPAEARFNPLLYPPRAIGADGDPLAFRPHMGRIACEVHLVGIIGRTCYNIVAEDALASLEGVAVMLKVRDLSLGDWLTDPFDFEARGAHYLGGCADGFARLGRVVTEAEDLFNRPMTIGLKDGESATTSTADYRGRLAELVKVCCGQLTLLKGDVLSLGPAGPPLILPAQPGVDGRILRAEIEGLGSVEVRIEDERTPEAQQDNSGWLNGRVYHAASWR